MRILVVDDNVLIGDALRAILERRGHKVVAGAASPEGAVAAARTYLPEIVLVDLDGPLSAVLDTARGVSTALPQTCVVVVTRRADEEVLFQALRAGAQGYLTKDLHADRFCELLEGIEQGEPAISPGLARRLLQAFSAGPAATQTGTGHLTEREVEILTAMARGVTSNRPLAMALCVSENTVRFHVRNILSKLHLHSRAAAVAWALTHGVVGSEDGEA